MRLTYALLHPLAESLLKSRHKARWASSEKDIKSRSVVTYNAIQGLVFARELPIRDRSDTNFPAINFQSLASGNAGRKQFQKLM